MKLLAIFFLCLPTLALAELRSPKDLVRWKALLHVTNGFLSESSQADGLGFFVAENGKSDYLAEYHKSVELFQKDPLFNCKFPARAKFIAKELGEKKVKLGHCSDYLDFSKRLSAKSISLVFSSYYLNNPSSAFGHTLLRFKKEADVEESEKYQLLDYAANFSANVTTSNALIYAIKGTFGGFHGEFAVMPYFYKIREYNDFESRDLWDYELNITADEIDWVIAHLWEMKQTYFDYYYLSENCSYHILGLLNVANPEWKLLERISSNVPPVDTIKAIARAPGLLKHIGFRPSKRRVLLASYEGLSAKERELFNTFKGEPWEANLSEADIQTQARVLDALIEYFDFQNADAIVSDDKEVLKNRQELLIKRAETGVSTVPLKVAMPKIEAPHQGHETARLGLHMGHSKKGKLTSKLALRPALHDLLDPIAGQNPNAIMEMGHLELRHYNDKAGAKKLYLDRADFIQVLSISPFSTLIPKASWRLRLGSERINDRSCDSCYTPSLDGAYGFAFGKDSVKWGLLLHSEFQAHKELSREGYRVGAGPESFFLLRASADFSLKVFGSYDWWAWSHLERSYEYGAKASWHIGISTSITASHTRLRGENESLIGANFFF